MMRPSSTSKRTPKTNINSLSSSKQHDLTRGYFSNKSKSSARHLYGSRERLNTVSSGESSLQPKNLTINFGSAVPPEIDWELECHFAYSEYLQALMKRELCREKFEENKTSMTDQLSLQNKSLFEDLQALDALKHRYSVACVHNEFNEVLEKATQLLEGFHRVCADSNLLGKLDNSIDIVNTIKNKILIQNITPLQSQEEYDKLQVLLEQCNETCEKIVNTSGDKVLLSRLAEVLKDTIQLKKNILDFNEHMIQNEQVVAFNNIKAMSDDFALLSANGVEKM